MLSLHRFIGAVEMEQTDLNVARNAKNESGLAF
jgi:hypothetical protein